MVERRQRPNELEEINKLGYLSSRYDIYQDVWTGGRGRAEVDALREGWPDDLVWLPNGDWMRGWAHHQKNKDGTMNDLPWRRDLLVRGRFLRARETDSPRN